MTQALIRAVKKGLCEADWAVVEGGFSRVGTWKKAVDPIEQYIQRRIAKAVSAEREACAVIAETPVGGEQDDITMEAKDRVANAIRARGN